MPRKREQGIFLRTRDKEDDSNGYQFRNRQHAREWLRQKFINDRDYGVSIKSFTRRLCCGRPTNFKLVKRMKVSEFLEHFDTEEDPEND